MSREQLLTRTFVELADTLQDDFDVLDLLQNLVDRSAEILEASATGLILADQRGALQLVASTAHVVEVLELLAIATDQGPCIDSFHTGLAVFNVPSAEARRRWPEFMRNADELGYRAIHVVPMRLRGEVLGALSLAFVEETFLDDDDLAVAQALASVATIGLLQDRTPRQREILARQLQTALHLHVLVEQATGVVAELAAVGVEEGLHLITSYSRLHGQPLSEVARKVLDGSLGLDQLHGARPRPESS